MPRAKNKPKNQNLNIASAPMTSDQEALVKAWKQDFTLAAEDILDVDLWWGQRLILRSSTDSKFNMVNGARGMGKTFLIAVIAILHAILRPNTRVLIISASYRQSKLAFFEIDRLYSRISKFRNCCARRPITAMDECRLEFKNGSRITALPLGDGNKIRGHRAHVVLADEWVQIPLSILNQVIFPMMNVPKDPMGEIARWRREMALRRQGKRSSKPADPGNSIVLFSTGWWKFDPHYDIWNEWINCEKAGDDRYKTFHFTYKDVPTFTECLDEDCGQIQEGMFDVCPDCGGTNVRRHGFLDMDQIEMQQRIQSDVAFAMETLACWVEDTKGFYKRSSIFRCTPSSGSQFAFTVEIQADKKSRYVLGIDPAREDDRFAFVVLKLGDAKNQVVFSRSIGPDDYETNNPTGEMADFIKRLHRVFNFSAIAMDRGGGGSQLRDLLTEESVVFDPETGKSITLPPILEVEENNFGGIHLLDLVDFSPEWINKVAFDLLADIDRRRIWFPVTPVNGDPSLEVVYDDVQELILELTYIITKPLQRGKLHFQTATKSQKKDRATALWLALHAANTISSLGDSAPPPLRSFGIAASTFLGLVTNDNVARQQAPVVVGKAAAVSPSPVTQRIMGSSTMAVNASAASLKGRQRRSLTRKKKK